MSHLKSITTFSLDVNLKDRFYKNVPSNKRTFIIEGLISDYLNKKSEGLPKPSKTHSKQPRKEMTC
ncbi:hypothetical protein NMT12_40109 [metagenome]